MQNIELTTENQEAINHITSGALATFISGKAGVGKTTLTKVLINHFQQMKKNIAIVAPTGIAALQAGGSTINSFFKFQFGVVNAANMRKIKDPELYKALNIVFIDEISMTRADVIDAIDIFLRRARGIKKPFGGVQMVFIGDLFQLPPVVTDDDKKILNELGYTSGNYFFNAKVFTQIPLKAIELTKVFRQKDIVFTNMLNKIRVGEDVASVIASLNSKCYRPGVPQNPLSVTLSTTNAIADKKNALELSKLKTPAVTFKASYKGDFKLNGSNLPSPEVLVLKAGSLVMFTNNDKDKRWVNGMVGEVVAINPIDVTVRTQYGDNVVVERNEWISYEYELMGGKVIQKEVGSYSQIPLTLGWAITIHKSQGKTIKNLHVDLGYGAFASGQTYVALSRAVDIEGLSLERPIKQTDVICCPIVKNYFNPVFELV